MTSPDDAAKFAGPTSLFVPVDIVPLTASPDRLPRSLRGIRCEGAGTVTVTTGSGESRVIPFLEGETRFCLITHVTAMTATGVEGLV